MTSTPAQVEARDQRVQALLRSPMTSGTVRFVVSLAVGLAVAAVVAVMWALRYGVLTGLMTTAAVYVVSTYLAVRRFKGFGTWRHAGPEDTNWLVRDVGIAMVIVGNLAGVVTLLALDHGDGHDVDAGLAVGSVLLSWFLLHTLYAPHYARLFYGPSSSEPGVPSLELLDHATGQNHAVAGGISFNADGYWPSYADFTYFAFNLGMTFQVSDTSVSSPTIRRLVLGHCLLSYLFATAITATVINLVIGLVS